MEEDGASETPVRTSDRRDGKHPSREAADAEGDKQKGNSDSAQGSGQSLGDRLRASGRMVLHAMASSATAMPSIAPESKAVAGPADSDDQRRRVREEASQTSPLLADRTGDAQAKVTYDSIRAIHYSGDSSTAFGAFMSDPPHLYRMPSGEAGSRPRGAQVALASAAAAVPQSAISRQEATDGADVVYLMSLSGDLAADADCIDESDGALSSAEAARLRKALFGCEKTSSRVYWDQLLNFTPDSADGPADLRLLTGTTDKPLANRVWLQQWESVLVAYTDEVWGDLGPLAAEAKYEVDRLSGNGGQRHEEIETKALGRLRQILAHVRGGL